MLTCHRPPVVQKSFSERRLRSWNPPWAGAGREINLTAAVNKDTITRGLRYSIATGNWGMQGTAGMRAGVSQACAPARPVLSRGQCLLAGPIGQVSSTGRAWLCS